MLVVGRAAMRQAAIDIVLNGVDPTGKVVLPPGQRGIRALYKRWAEKLGAKVEFAGGSTGWQGCTCPHVVKYSGKNALAQVTEHASDFKNTKISHESQEIVCFNINCEVHYERVHNDPDLRRLDLFGLTKYLFGLDKRIDAVKMILDEYGVPYKEEEVPLSPEQRRQLRVREALQAAQRQTIEWLQTHPDAAPHRKYLAYERGISDQPVTKEQAADPNFWLHLPRQQIWDDLGWGAFIGRGRLRDWLKERYADVYPDFVSETGISDGGEAADGGGVQHRRVPLVYRRQDGSEMDAAYDRIAMWTHYRGEITQCAARAIYENPVKNRNLGSARHLMNLDRAGKYGEWIMVEGQMCLATLLLLGWENVVCCYGSNGWKSGMLAQAIGAAASGGKGRTINLALDHDPAGFRATLKIGRQLESAGCEVYVMVLPYKWQEKRNGSRVIRSMKGIDFNDILRQSASRDEARARIMALYQRRITLSQFAVYAAQFEFGDLNSKDEWVAARDGIRYARTVMPALATVSPAEEEFLCRFWADLLHLPPKTTRAQIAYARAHAAPTLIGLDRLKQSAEPRVFLLAQTEALGDWARQLTQLPVVSLPEQISRTVLEPLGQYTDRNLIVLIDPERIISARRLVAYLAATVYGSERAQRQLRIVVADDRPADSAGFARLLQTGVSSTVFAQETRDPDEEPQPAAREVAG